MYRERIAMMDFLALVALLMTVILLSACESKSEEDDATIDGVTRDVAELNEDDMDSPEDVVEAYEEARNARDAVRVTGLVIERIAKEGEEAISEGWDEISSTRFDVVEVEKRSEDKVWVIGKYHVDYEDGTVRDEDYWVFPVYKENGEWKVDPDGAEEATEQWRKENEDVPNESN